MRKLLKGSAITALVALSLIGSTSDALAKDARHGRETAWTLPANDLGAVEEFLGDGVTWEE